MADGKYLIEQDHPNCIGCSACVAVAPDHWKMADDGKASITEGKVREDLWEEKDIEEAELKHYKESAESCPVNCIHIVSTADKKKLI
jgi:ferredoxin